MASHGSLVGHRHQSGFATVVPVATLVALVTAYYWKALTTAATVARMPTDSDVLSTFWPRLVDQFDAVQRHGFVPEWVDRVGLGQLTTGFTGVYYAPRAVVLAVASNAAAAGDLLIWSHAVVAALGAYALARFYRLAPWPSTIAAAAYALCHLAVRWAPLNHAPAHFATLPFALLGAELIWRRRALLGASLLALAVGLSGLGTVVQFTHLMIQMVGAVAAFRLLTSAFSWRARLAPAAITAAAIAVGLVIAAPGLVPFISEQAHSVRQHTAFDSVIGFDRRALLSVFSASAAKDPIAVNQDLFLGVFAAPLLVVGLVVAARRRELALLPILVVAGVLIGTKTVLLRALVELVPGWDVITNVQRVSFIVVLPMAILVGVGADRIARIRLRGAGGRRLLALLPVAVLFLTVLTAARETEQGWRPIANRPPAVDRGWLQLVNENDDRDGRWMSLCQPLQPFVYRPVKFLEARGRWLDTYESFVVRDYYDYWRALTGSNYYEGFRSGFGQWNQHQPEDPVPNQALVNAAGVSRVLATTLCPRPDWLTLPNGDQTTPLIGHYPGIRLAVYENPGAFPPAYVSSRTRAVTGRRQAIAGLSATTPEFSSHTDFVEGAADIGSGGSPAAAQLRRLSPHRIDIVVPPTEQRALVVASEHFHDAWHASVRQSGGRWTSRPVVRVNGIFQGVIVEPGTTAVRLDFEPWWRRRVVPASRAVALATLIALGVALVRSRRRGFG